MAAPTVRTLSLCSGAGGLDLGVDLALAGRARAVCYVEREAFAAALLVAGMEAKALDPAPIWDDLATFGGRAWRGCVDLVLAGFPCPPFSAAGKRLGAADKRDLWPHVARIVREVGPGFVFLENVRGAVRHPDGLGRWVGELADLGYSCSWDVFSAAGVGAPHRRERVFMLAYADGRGLEELGEPERSRIESERGGLALGCSHDGPELRAWPPGPDGDWSGVPAEAQPSIRGVADGMASRVDRLRACGNGVVPLVAAHALRTLAARMTD